MNFNDLYAALKSNEVEITDAILTTFGLSDAEDLRFWANEHRSYATRHPSSRVESLSIAENLEWAADQIVRLSKAAA